jgi:hypothetical protein
MTNRIKYLLVILNIIFISLSAFLYSRLTNNQQVYKQQQLAHQNTLNTYQSIARASRLLLQGNYPEALEIYAQADKMASAPAGWHAMGKNFMERSQQTRDTLNHLKNEAAALNKEFHQVADKNRSVLGYVGQLQEKINADSVQMQEYLLTNRNLSDTLDHLVAEAAKKPEVSFGKLEFRNTTGNLVSYLGEISDSTANGYGIGIFELKSIYEGEWQNNLRHGEGKYIWANGDIYEGYFNEGKREGWGTYIFSTGEKYVGEWQGDVRDGRGTFYSKDGGVLLEGNWHNDKYQKLTAANQ